MSKLMCLKSVAVVLTIVSLGNSWAVLACLPHIQNAFARGSIAMATVILIGISIERWSAFLKEYIRVELEKHTSDRAVGGTE